MRYSVDPELFARFSGFRRAVVVARDIDNTGERPELLALLRRCENAARGPELEDFWNHPRLAAWAGTFSAMGLNPKRYPPSVINLIKRTRGGTDLPFVNPLVAVFNCISLRCLAPCGGDDLAVVTGDLRLGFAAGTERYVPLGKPDALETPPAGEVIYMDTGNADVFCRAWCWKNGDRSKLTPETNAAAINIDGMPPLTLADLKPIAEEAAELLRRHTGARTEIHYLSPDNTSFDF